MKRLFLGFAWLGWLVAALPAQVVTYQVTGSFTTVNGSLLGMSSAPATFTGTFTVDLAQNTSTAGALAGQMLDGVETAHDFFGFSASSLVSVSFTTGTKVWTAAELDPHGPTADFWASSDLTTAPQYLAMSFIFLDGPDEYVFSVGRRRVGVVTELNNVLQLADSNSNDADGTFTVSAVAVPEPSTYAGLLGAAALGLALWRRQRARA